MAHGSSAAPSRWANVWRIYPATDSLQCDPQPADSTVMKSRIQPTWHWSATRVWPGTLATRGAPGVAAVSSCRVLGLMSSCIAVTAPALRRAPDRSTGRESPAAAYSRFCLLYTSDAADE